MDLKTGWDFRREDHRERARQYIDEKKPKLIIGSPECTMFATLHNLNKWNGEKARKWNEARSHIRFMMEIYTKQHQEG
eukprot:4435979-Lingulodinium_polyedra.AAC.1